jgi:hypothetical protein
MKEYRFILQNNDGVFKDVSLPSSRIEKIEVVPVSFEDTETAEAYVEVSGYKAKGKTSAEEEIYEILERGGFGLECDTPAGAAVVITTKEGYQLIATSLLEDYNLTSMMRDSQRKVVELNTACYAFQDFTHSEKIQPFTQNDNDLIKFLTYLVAARALNKINTAEFTWDNIDTDYAISTVIYMP